MGWIGIDLDDGIELGDVTAVFETEDGQRQTRNSTITTSTILAKQASAEEIVQRDFREAYDASVKVPMDAICDRLSKLVISGKPVNITPRVGSSIEEGLHGSLLKIDEKHDQSFRTSEDQKKMPALSTWMKKHASVLPYSISIRKCSDISCCLPCRSAAEIRDLVLQRQPTPRLDTTNAREKSHFLSRDDAHKIFGNNPGALCDLSDLPSKAGDDLKQAEKSKSNRDKDVAAKMKLRSWEAKKVRSIVKCYNCNKSRCVYSLELNDEYYKAARELAVRLESISGYSCGDLIFDDGHPISNVIAQKQQLTCDNKIEVAYYNVEGRSFKTAPICIHCGETGSNEFLCQQAQLEMNNKSEGKKCFPICVDCIDEGKKVVHYGKSKTNEQQKRKEDASKKADAAAKSKRAKTT